MYAEVANSSTKSTVKPNQATYNHYWKTLHDNSQKMAIAEQQVVFEGILLELRAVCNCFEHARIIYKSMLGYDARLLSQLNNTVFFMRFLHNEINIRLSKPTFVCQFCESCGHKYHI